MRDIDRHAIAGMCARYRTGTSGTQFIGRVGCRTTALSASRSRARRNMAAVAISGGAKLQGRLFVGHDSLAVYLCVARVDHRSLAFVHVAKETIGEHEGR
jgi:hypothetical protein